ncbi:MAG: hypothetical protein ABWY47_18185, partial [Xanthobacteraceae bacterium]
EFGSVGHHHLDGVIVGMQVGFHGLVPAWRARGSRGLVKSRGSITQAPAGNKRIQIAHGDVSLRAPIRSAGSRQVERTALGQPAIGAARPDCHPPPGGALSRRCGLLSGKAARAG